MYCTSGTAGEKDRDQGSGARGQGPEIETQREEKREKRTENGLRSPWAEIDAGSTVVHANVNAPQADFCRLFSCLFSLISIKKC